MKNDSIYNIINCPLLFYSNFSKEELDEYGTVSIARFENDIKYFISLGYKFYSLNELYNVIDDNGTVGEKSLCLAFIDGFESEYTLAFEVITRYGIHADIFINPQNIGVESNTGIKRFTWSQAREMCSSGLINIQVFYHEFSQDESVEYVHELIGVIKHELGADNGTSFLNSVGNTITINNLDALKKIGLKSQVIYYKQLCIDSINKTCFGHMSMENSISVVDFEKYMLECKSALTIGISTNLKSQSENNQFLHDFSSIDDSIFLDVIENPIITNRPCIAFPMSVLGVKNHNVYSDFFALEFISLIALDSINYFGFDNFDYKMWPMLETHYIGSDVIRNNDLNPLLLIYNALKNGYCVDLCSDAFYIPGKAFYNSEHISHNILIFGYDSDKNKFKTLTHINTGKYTYLDVIPKNLFDSLSTMFFEHLTLLRKNNWHRAYYAKHTIKQLLCDYKNSTDMTFYTKPYIDFFNTKIVGAKAVEWFRDKIANGDIIVYANLKAFIEHKQCMSWRIKYVAGKMGIDISSFLSLLSQLDGSDILLPLAIKYNLTLDASIKDRIICEIDKINIAENALISFIIKQL